MMELTAGTASIAALPIQFQTFGYVLKSALS